MTLKNKSPIMCDVWVLNSTIQLVKIWIIFLICSQTSWHTESNLVQGHSCGSRCYSIDVCLFVCVEVLQPTQLNGVMNAVSLPNHTFTGQA